MGASGIIVTLAVIFATILIAIGACALLGVAIFVIVKNNKTASTAKEHDVTDTADTEADDITEEADTEATAEATEENE